MTRKPDQEKLRAQGARIRAAVDKTGRSYAEVARQLDVGQNTFNRWMRGENSAEGRFQDLSVATGVSVEWLRDGEGSDVADHRTLIERFIGDFRESLRITPAEANFLRAWPHHRVREGALLDALMDSRRGFTAEETRASIEVTSDARARGEALGVPARTKT